MVGNWEPMFHRIRGGYGFTNEKDRYDQEHSEEMVRQLADEGINFVMMHYYKGMGFEREKPDMEDTRRFIEICHKHDILVGTYTQWGTFWNETFPDEHPNAMDYAQQNQFGQPSMYSEIYFSYHRTRVCGSSEEFRNFLLEVVRYSVETIGTDMVYFDNLGQNPCYCERCKKAFPEFIARRYPTEADRNARFGFSNLDRIQIPYGTYWRPIHCLDTISDPLVQDWIEFRCQQLHDGLAEVKEMLGTLSRNVPLAINPPILYGDNAPLAYGTDWFRIMDVTRMTYSEDGSVTGTYNGDRLITQHRAYKMARAGNNSVLRFHTPWVFVEEIEPEVIALTEAAIFNDGNLATVKSYGSIATPLRPMQRDYIKYFHNHAGDYAGVEQISEVAVYKNFQSLAWSWFNVWPQVTIIEQLLIQSGTQFSYVFNDDLDDLSKYKTLVVPEMQCLTQSQAEKMASFVERGGGLLATGQSGACDLSYRRYEMNLLAGAMGRQIGNLSATAFVAVGAGAGGDLKPESENLDRLSQRWEWGAGRVCWIPKAVMARPLDPPEPNQIHTMIHTNNFWVLPKNWQEILDGLDWAMGNGRWIPMKTPSTVVPQVSRSADNERLLLHLINYDPNKKIEGLTLNVASELVGSLKALWRTPETPEPVDLKSSGSDSAVRFDLPPWNLHCTIILS